LLERDAGVTAGQFVTLFQGLIRQRLDGLDVIDGTHAQIFDVHAVQRIAAVDTAAGLVARLVVLEAITAVGVAAAFAVAVVFFVHHLVSLIRGYPG
jgi:hypothetical protein